MTSSTDEGQDRDWTEELDGFLRSTQTGLTVFTGLWAHREEQPYADMRRQVAKKIVHNMFQFVERHGAQGGKHAEDQPRPGTEGGSAEPRGDASEAPHID